MSQGMATCCAKGNQGSKEMRSQSEEGGVKDGRKDYGARNTCLLVNIRYKMCIIYEDLVWKWIIQFNFMAVTMMIVMMTVWMEVYNQGLSDRL